MISDAAKRTADTYALHKIASPDNVGKWFAAKLSDGTTDNELYDSKRDAVLHQHHDEDYYMFVQIVPGHMTEQDAQNYLNASRKMYDAGLRLADREHRNGGRDRIKRLSIEDERNSLRSIFGKGKPSNLIIPGLGEF